MKLQHTAWNRSGLHRRLECKKQACLCVVCLRFSSCRPVVISTHRASAGCDAPPPHLAHAVGHFFGIGQDSQYGLGHHLAHSRAGFGGRAAEVGR